MEEIQLNDVNRLFKTHLSQEDNFRTIFSGKYGVGKTYFLNNFFKEYEKEYYAIRISPLKYITSSNSDIFEYIKADILFALFKDDKIEFKPDYEFSNWATINKLLEDPKMLFAALIPLVVSVGLPLESVAASGLIYKATKKIQESYQQFRSKKKTSLNTENNNLKDFINSLNEPGSPFEQNIVSLFIRECLNNINVENEIVLIIDDLDRLDPDHIFRILNILSVQNDYAGTANKFNFDKVVLVCDMDNIERIFAHRYGAEVDFMGYMDKFFSIDIFNFSNEKAILKYVDDLKLKMSEPVLHTYKLILKNLVVNNNITLRQLVKVKYSINDYTDYVVFEEPLISYDDLPALTQIKFLACIDQKVENLKLMASSLECLKIVKGLVNIFGSLDKLRDILNKGMNRNLISHKDTEPIVKTFALFNYFQYLPQKSFLRRINYRPDSTSEYWPSIRYEGLADVVFQFEWSSENKYKTACFFKNTIIDVKIDNPPKHPTIIPMVFSMILFLERQDRLKDYCIN